MSHMLRCLLHTDVAHFTYFAQYTAIHLQCQLLQQLNPQHTLFFLASYAKRFVAPVDSHLH
jgi:hypothetical protein